jgi:hypothetical protein
MTGTIGLILSFVSMQAAPVHFAGQHISLFLAGARVSSGSCVRSATEVPNRKAKTDAEPDMSERNEENDEADAKTIRARADLRSIARTSPPIPDALMQEAHKLIEADRENARQ